jgi:uncharacterized protein YggE
MYHHPAWTPSPVPVKTPRFSHNNPYTIEVTGEGTVCAAPDKANITLGSLTENVSLTAAQKENAAAVSDIINSLIAIGIPKEHIQTVNYRIDTEYNYEDGKQTFRHYKVTHLLQVSIDKVELTGLVVDTAVNHGANSVSNIEFTIAYPEAYYNQALSLAITNGQNKANTIAAALGVTLKFPAQVQEVLRPLEPAPYPAPLYAKSAGAATPIQPGELKISAAVKAVYFYL